MVNQLSKLTSKSKLLDNLWINTIYSKHVEALKITSIAPKIFPTFLELETLCDLKNKEEKEIEKEVKKKRCKRERHSFVSELGNACYRQKHLPLHAHPKNYEITTTSIGCVYSYHTTSFPT